MTWRANSRLPQASSHKGGLADFSSSSISVAIGSASRRPDTGNWAIRHGAVMLSGAALVCQDLSHVEMMLPFKDGENVVFCRPDLSDLREHVNRLLSDDAVRVRIARAGRQSYMDWARGWRDHLQKGIEAHVHEAVRGSKRRHQQEPSRA